MKWRAAFAPEESLLVCDTVHGPAWSLLYLVADISWEGVSEDDLGWLGLESWLILIK